MKPKRYDRNLQIKLLEILAPVFVLSYTVTQLVFAQVSTEKTRVGSERCHVIHHRYLCPLSPPQVQLNLSNCPTCRKNIHC